MGQAMGSITASVHTSMTSGSALAAASWAAVRVARHYVLVVFAGREHGHSLGGRGFHGHWRKARVNREAFGSCYVAGPQRHAHQGLVGGGLNFDQVALAGRRGRLGCFGSGRFGGGRFFHDVAAIKVW